MGTLWAIRTTKYGQEIPADTPPDKFDLVKDQLEREYERELGISQLTGDITSGPGFSSPLFSAVDHVRSGLREIGFDPDSDPSTQRTPERWLKYLLEFMQPYNLDEVLGPRFEAVHDNTSIHGMIVQSHIPYTAICEHHLLPFQGEVHLGYIPDQKIIGLSKMARLVHAISHEKPGIQEAHTEKVADALFLGVPAKGAMVVIRAKHSCMGCRGVNTPEVVTTTSCVKGLFRDVVAAREEFLSLIGLR